MTSARSSSPPAIPLHCSVAIVVMGVSGCGKSVVSEALANALGLDFVEGDSMHPAENIEKMSHGIPLTDEDRFPWLDRIGSEIHRTLQSGRGIVVSCSALRKSYRDLLRRQAGVSLRFLFLQGSEHVLQQRMTSRTGHFMPASLLKSQLATLEDPSGEPGVIKVEIDAPVDSVISEAISRVRAALNPA